MNFQNFLVKFLVKFIRILVEITKILINPIKHFSQWSIRVGRKLELSVVHESLSILATWIKFGVRRTIADVTYAFLFRPDPRRHTWPPCRLSRFWQRPARTRATTRNVWDSGWSRCRSPCQLFRPQRWVIIMCEGEEGHTYRERQSSSGK